jgi:hypothetical protein
MKNGELPCSAGERRILKAAASIAAGIPIDLHDTATGLDARNLQRLITAISHAAGQRPPMTVPQCLHNYALRHLYW